MPIRSYIFKTVAFCSLGLFAMAAAAQRFNQPLMIPTGNWPAGIVAADLNGDGKADLIYTDYGATATASTPFAGTSVAGLLALFIPGKRRRAVKGLLMALVALCGMATLSGCGACTDLGTKPGTYTIRVIGTSAANVVTTKVQVVVQE